MSKRSDVQISGMKHNKERFIAQQNKIAEQLPYALYQPMNRAQRRAAQFNRKIKAQGVIL